VGIFLEGEDFRSDHGLGRLVDFKFKAPPGTTSPSITTHTPSGQRNCASWAFQPQKSLTLLPCPGGRTTKSTKDIEGYWGGEIGLLVGKMVGCTEPLYFTFLRVSKGKKSYFKENTSITAKRAISLPKADVAMRGE
jgi:hypothetical protein